MPLGAHPVWWSPLITRLAEEELKVYGINYKNDPADARNWLARYGNPYERIGSDTHGRVGIEFGVTGMPESFLVDRRGVIRYKQVGVITPAILHETILPLIDRLRKKVDPPDPAVSPS